MKTTPKLREVDRLRRSGPKHSTQAALRRRSAILLGLGLSTTACVVDELGAPSELEDDGTVSATDELEFDAGQEPIPTSSGGGLGQQMIGCVGARIVGMLDHADLSCNVQGMPGGWMATRVFEQGTPSLATSGLTAPGELGRYCFFEAQTTPQTEAEYDAMLGAIASSGVMDIDTVEADCRGQVPQASLNDPAVSAAMHDVFRDNIDWVDPSALIGGYGHAVQVSVLDTVSDLAALGGAVPSNEHGLQIAALIDDIACPLGASCHLQLEHQLALPREDWSTPPDWSSGGDHGTKVDVALALYEEVALWHRDLAMAIPGTPERLVVNLSLGYDRDSTTSLTGVRGPESALKSALEYAACSGALVFTAAGNDRDPSCDAGTDDDGPLFPGAYASSSALTSIECFSAGYPHTDPSTLRPVFSSSARPLVYAVGGVDASDERLLNARTNGQPKLVAPGDHGIAEYAPGDYHNALTGTSIATAVASGAAALIWTYNPTLRPDEVADVLYSSGWATGDTAEFGSSAATPVRRLSVCAALDQACAGAGPGCPRPGCVAGPANGAGNLGGYINEVDDVLAFGSVWANPNEPSEDLLSCSSSLWSDLAEPQPEVPPCPHCNVDIPPEDESTAPDDMLTMELDSKWRGLVSSGYLTVYDATRSATRFGLDADTITKLNDGYVTTTILDVSDTVKATLTFTVKDSGRTYTSSNSITVTR